MPLPRKSTITGRASTKKKPTTRRKTPTTTAKAKRGELLLATAGPAMNDYIVRSMAESLVMSVIERPDGRILQVIDTRIEGKRIYGKMRELHEAAPYMFI
jgi:hypothetical protein